jgi:Arc/MetJ-type ribon-helix-helix transcriptional regulator
MTVQLSPEQQHVIDQAMESGKYRSVDEVLDSALEGMRQREGIRPSLQRTREAVDRIRELRKGFTLGGISIKELIEDGRE